MVRGRTKKTAPEPPARAHPMAELLAGVTPLDGPTRVARLRERAESRAVRAASAAPTAYAFVMHREDDRVEAHRADLRAPRVFPGRTRQWHPEVRLDLHGMRTRDVEARLSAAIRECTRCPGGRLLVIHGKGLHSVRGESVLFDAVVEVLSTGRHARFVLAFATAPARLGGSGALAVEIDV
ncbi:MAG TPA: Smr/MutS family protein [Polyangiaceae bacterium]|jgi:DNA-nicking Smr family endonuclease|nr:Smr/MutS family protein [Polyangiaceae bacterium]